MSVTTSERNRAASPLMSVPMPRRKSERRSWKTDDGTLIALWNDSDDTQEQIAVKLKRSIGGIRYRACFLRQHGVYLRDRKGGYLPEDVRLRTAPPKPDKRKCNLCRTVFQPRTRFERFCPTCRRNERMNSIGRVDGNWGLW